MKSNELRIGNYVNIDGDALYVTGSDIAYFEYNDKEYTAIPLTPEILEKAGFEKVYSESDFGITVEETNHLQEYGGTRTYFDGWKDRSIGVSSNMFCHGVRLLYVHQLQNLYFALTGEELPIEL